MSDIEKKSDRTIISISGPVGWVSDDMSCFSVFGFGLVHQSKDLVLEVKKGQFVQLFLRLWSKESPEGRMQRFYVTGGLK